MLDHADIFLLIDIHDGIRFAFTIKQIDLVIFSDIFSKRS